MILNNFDGCYFNVCIVFLVDVGFIKFYFLLGCLVYDIVYGKNFLFDIFLIIILILN